MEPQLLEVADRDEVARIAAVRRYDILDTPPDGAFDCIAALAARLFDVPIATITIVDSDRIWFKATYGLDVPQIDRDPGLCASAILQDDPYVVVDAITDIRCLDNPLVHGEMGVRFYAAAPIRTSEGYNLGTVNVLSGQPRAVTDAEMVSLQDLASIVADELELRLESRRTIAAERRQRLRAEKLIDVLQSRLVPHRAARVPGLDLAMYYRPAATELDIGGDFIDVFPAHGDRWALVIGDVCGKGPAAAAVTGEIRAALRALAHTRPQPGEVMVRLNEVLHIGRGEGVEDEQFERFCTAQMVQVERTAGGVRVTAATAGHPLALVRRRDGQVEWFGTPGQLVGAVPDIAVPEATADLRDGDALLLYTDGAVEQHGVPISVGEDALVEAFRTAPTDSADAAIAHVRDAVLHLHTGYDDDVALILALVRSDDA